MKKLKSLSRKAVVLILTFAMAFSPVVSFADADAKQFTYNMISTESNAVTTAKFMSLDGEIYIAGDSVEFLSNDVSSRDSDSKKYAYEMANGKDSVAFTKKEVITDNDGNIYYPFDKVMGGLNLHASALKDGILVQPGADMRTLVEDMNAIRRNNGYNMSYWQNSPLWKAGSSAKKIFSMDALKYSSFASVSYAYDAIDTNKYTSALWSILLPQTENDILRENIVSLLGEAFSSLGTTAGGAKEINEQLDKLSSSPGSGKLSEVLEGVELVSNTVDYGMTYLNGYLHMFNVFANAENIDKSLLHAVELLSQNVSPKSNKTMAKAVDDVLFLHNDDVPMEGKMIYTALNSTVDAILENNSLIDLGNLTRDHLDSVAGAIFSACLSECQGAYDAMVADGLEKIEGTAKAARMLELQNQCLSIYDDSFGLLAKALVSKNNIDGINAKNTFLREMHSLTVFYLRAGVEAYRALLVDNKDAAYTKGVNDMIDKMNKELAKLAAYNMDSFDTVGSARKVEAVLADYASTLDTQPEPKPIPEPVATSGKIVHDWIMSNARIRLSLKADGTFRYENDNNHKRENGTYSYDEAKNELVIPEMDDEAHTGFINEFDELEIHSDTGFMLLQREANVPLPEIYPGRSLNGVWTADDKTTFTFEDFTYIYDNGSTVTTGEYTVENLRGELYVYFLTNSMDLEIASAYITGQQLGMFMSDTYDVYIPNDINDFPFIGTGSDN